MSYLQMCITLWSFRIWDVEQKRNLLRMQTRNGENVTYKALFHARFDQAVDRQYVRKPNIAKT